VKRILVVDDEPSLREVLADILRDEGYAVLTAANGRAGVAMLESDAPDLVLMDIMMPVMGGREASRAMRAHPHGRTIPIVLSSASTAPRPLDPGIAAYLAKPFDIDQLLELVERLLSGSPAQ
jgi:CheY-like chemotaxis protein